MVARYVVSPRGGRRGYPDITSALRAAAARGRAAQIEIAPGHYDEMLLVRGEVRLVALEGSGSVVVSRPHGTVLESSGAVRVEGLVLTGNDTEADAVACQWGTLTLDHTEVRVRGGVAVHARSHTSVTLRDSTVRHGRTLFSGSSGLVERCRFTDAADNAIAVIEGARVSVHGSRIEGSRIHGVRVCDAYGVVTGCELTGTGNAALMADTRAELTVADCTITAVHAEGIMFIEQSRGSVDRTRVTDARHGIGAASGADPVVRGCVLTACRDTGINVQTSGRGRFEDCQVVGAGNVAVFSTKGGAPEVRGCRVSGGNVGIAVTEGARGRFSGIGIEDLTGSALRVFDDDSTAVFERVRVDRCPSGLEVRGNGGTTAEVADSEFHDFALAAVAVGGQARVSLKGIRAERGVLGFGVGEEASLRVSDSGVRAVTSGGAVVFGGARLFATDLAVTGSGALGVYGRDSAYLDVTRGVFTDCAAVGAAFDDECGGRLVDCSVSGPGDTAVRHNGRVDLVSLSTSLPVVRNEEPVEVPPTIVNIFNGPVFNKPVINSHILWNNDNVNHVIQRHTTEDGLAHE
ncbi:right-handed parallel beta-helix repeat-containing protein [Streptomyces sp. NPDC046182]|uniref:right-handed parallel beta-helix repeat-containing protein n=1 Tax=Streptomyces sp. NPDC046182 TaxID=3154601 RepID=UPI0033FA0AE8